MVVMVQEFVQLLVRMLWLILLILALFRLIADGLSVLLYRIMIITTKGFHKSRAWSISYAYTLACSCTSVLTARTSGISCTVIIKWSWYTAQFFKWSLIKNNMNRCSPFTNAMNSSYGRARRNSHSSAIVKWDKSKKNGLQDRKQRVMMISFCGDYVARKDPSSQPHPQPGTCLRMRCEWYIHRARVRFHASSFV